MTGATSVCKSQTSVTYTSSSVPSATSYTWSVTGGAIINPLGLTANVNYTTATGNAVVRVNGVNSCGASQPGSLSVNVNLFCRTAADEMTTDFAGELSAYPNPTSGKATVEFTSPSDSKVMMTITGLVGNIIMSDVINAIEGYNTKDIDLSNLAKGTYLLNLKSGENVSKTIRLVVE